MESTNWRSTPPGGEPTMEAADWRTHLQPDSRQRIVNKIMDTLKRHLPFSGQEGLNELKKIAGRFEEKIYTAATSESDYLRRISLKMLSMEAKSQNAMSSTLPPNGGGLGNMVVEGIAREKKQEERVQDATNEPIDDTSASFVKELELLLLEDTTPASAANDGRPTSPLA